MTRMPDLNTEKVSFIGYYDIQDSEIENGKNFEPTQLNFASSTDDNLDTEYQDIYDNGVKLKITDNRTGRTIILRAGNKDDKWITAHIDRTGDNLTGDSKDLSTFSFESDSSNLNGDYDLMPWTDGIAREPSQNILFDAIKTALSSTDFWSNNNLNLNNSGLYNYSVNNQSQNTSIFSQDAPNSLSIAFTDVTTIHKAYLVGRIDDTHIQRNSTIYIDELSFGTPSRENYFAYEISNYLLNKEMKIENVSSNDPYGNVFGVYYFIIIWS